VENAIIVGGERNGLSIKTLLIIQQGSGEFLIPIKSSFTTKVGPKSKLDVITLITTRNILKN
jgi:hypothetical protein